MFPPRALNLKGHYSVIKKHGADQILSGLVSEHYGNLTLVLHSYTNFQPIFTNEVPKSKLRFLSIQQDIICCFI